MSYRFVWLTDTHIELPRWGVGEPAATIAHINGLDPEFVIVSGDLVEDCTDVDHFTLYKTTIVDALDCPVYNIPGNHDGASGDHTNYISVLGPIHFTSFTVQRVRFIGIVPSETTGLYATMPASELSYLEAELQALNNEIPIVFSHYPILPDFKWTAHITTGSTELLALLRAYNVNLYFSGHVHGRMKKAKIYGATHVNGGAFVPTAVDNTDSYMMVCDVNDDETMTVTALRGVSPWDERESFSVPCRLARHVTRLHLAGVHEED